MNYSKNIKKMSIGRRILISWVIVATLFFIIGFVFGKFNTKSEIRIYSEPDGIIKVGDFTPWEKQKLKFVPLDIPMDRDLQEFTFYLSVAYDIDFDLVIAIIQQESNFQTDVISKNGNYGLMQIDKINHPYLSEQLQIKDFLEPYSNIKAGMFILRELFDKYENPEKVLMAYSMGETGASRLWEQGIFETNYSKDVLLKQTELKMKEKGGDVN